MNHTNDESCGEQKILIGGNAPTPNSTACPLTALFMMNLAGYSRGYMPMDIIIAYKDYRSTSTVLKCSYCMQQDKKQKLLSWVEN